MIRTVRILGVVGTLAVLAGADAAALTAEGISPPAIAGAPAPDVTIRAQRDLKRSVTHFVDQISALENAEGLPRWNGRVCPLVTGLSRQDGEFILRRISQIAVAADVPLDGERCRPNLYVVVLADPRKDLQNLNWRRRMALFGQTNASVVQDFIATPRPVRVWYDTAMTDPYGTAPNTAPACIIGPLCNVPIFENTDPTRLSYNRIWNFLRVVLIVDKARMRTISVAQLADYAAMVGLAEIKPGAHLDGAPTILTLLDVAPEATPGGLSDWDRGFLKSLYATEQRSQGQRAQIAAGMVQDIVHR